MIAHVFVYPEQCEAATRAGLTKKPRQFRVSIEKKSVNVLLVEGTIDQYERFLGLVAPFQRRVEKKTGHRASKRY